MLADPLFWILVLPGLLLGAYAQSRIKINIAKYSQIRTQDGITGAQVARRLLDSEGLQAVAIESTPGMLSDHYDPRSKILRLSQQVYFFADFVRDRKRPGQGRSCHQSEPAGRQHHWRELCLRRTGDEAVRDFAPAHTQCEDHSPVGSTGR